MILDSTKFVVGQSDSIVGCYRKIAATTNVDWGVYRDIYGRDAKTPLQIYVETDNGPEFYEIVEKQDVEEVTQVDEITNSLRHNHMTRDIKERGACPGCDRYWESLS